MRVKQDEERGPGNLSITCIDVYEGQGSRKQSRSEPTAKMVDADVEPVQSRTWTGCSITPLATP